MLSLFAALGVPYITDQPDRPTNQPTNQPSFASVTGAAAVALIYRTASQSVAGPDAQIHSLSTRYRKGRGSPIELRANCSDGRRRPTRASRRWTARALASHGGPRSAERRLEIAR